MERTTPITGSPADLQRWAMGALEDIIHSVDTLYEEKEFTLRNIFNETKGNLGLAAHSIATHPKPIVRILTGFYIEAAGVAETDGPSAAAQMAYFFKKAGIECCVTTDKHCANICHAALFATKCEDMLEIVQNDEIETVLKTKTKWEKDGVTHVISIERPGPSWGNKDKACNMKNEYIEHYAPLDLLFWGDRRPWQSIGIGDRGNELGFASLPIQVLERDIPHGEQIACRAGADHLITSRVSNWAGNGLVAALGVLGNKEWLSHAKESLDPKLMRRIIRAMWQSGAVDGITFEKKPKRPSVDALPMGLHVEKASDMLHVLKVREQGMRKVRCVSGHSGMTLTCQ